MAISIVCSGCGKKYQVPDGSAGKKAKCQACGNMIDIPAASEIAQAKAPEKVQENPNRTNDLWDDLATAQASATQAMLSRDVAQPGTAIPGAFPIKKSKPEMWPIFQLNKWRIALVLGVIGGVLLFVGYREWRLASLSKAEPQKITLANLVKNGPGDNIHLDLTECRLLPELSVVSKEGRLGTDENTWRWTYAWIPAVPINQAGKPDLSKLKLIIGTKECHDKQDMFMFCRKTNFQGIIVNSTDSLKSDERKLLNEGLAGVDVSSCYLFRSGQHPVGAAIQLLLLGGGAILALACLGLLGLYFKQKFVG